MKTSICFKETQRFVIEWLWGVLLSAGVCGLFLYGDIKQVIFGLPWGTKPASNTALFICFGFTLLMTILLACIRLETRIKEDGVYVKFFPFQLTYKRFSWTEISKSYVRQYNPIGVYGGWGLRRNCYTLSGNMGLQLEFATGKRVLIGTNKSKELTETLISLGKYKK